MSVKKAKHILVVDDEQGSRESLKSIFSDRYTMSLAENADEAMVILRENRVDIILLDVIMPEKDGVTFLKEIQALYPELPVIMVSASSSVRPVVDAIRVGAYDYIRKPFEVAEIRRMVERAIQSISLHRKLEVLQTEISSQFPVDKIIGQSASFKKSLEDARKAAGTDSTVLLNGRSGTGKELVARLIHALSNRRDEPFVAVHCAALPETLMESELFGYEKGAFTNADRQKPGRFDLAGSGTLFFDEVGEMSASTQVKLLRVIEEREFMRVGGTQLIRTNARIVTATAKDLRKEVEENRFREDLYYRLSVVPIHLPPLRERRDDIPLLAGYFLNYFKQKIPSAIREFDPEALELMCRYEWPGNVRELRNLIERIFVLNGKSIRILPEFLSEEIRGSSGGLQTSAELENISLPLEEAVDSYERQLIEKALKESNGIQTRAAARLGTTRRKLKYRIERLNIQMPQHH